MLVNDLKLRSSFNKVVKLKKKNGTLKVFIVLQVVKISAAQIIIKPIHHSEMMIVCWLMCCFVSFYRQKRRNKIPKTKSLRVSIKKTGFLFGSPLSNEITQQQVSECMGPLLCIEIFIRCTLCFYLLLNSCTLYF